MKSNGKEDNGDPVKLRPFLPFIVLLSFSYTKDDIEVFMMYFLFAGTEYGCDFDEAFGIYLYVNAALQIIIQPMWARITDRYANYSTVLLWSALLGETVIEIFMFAVPGNNFGVILTLALIRSIIHTENTLAIWKVFKQKLDFSHFRDTAAHEKIINNIGMWGIVGEVILDVIIFTTGYFLCDQGVSFSIIAAFVYFMTTFPSLLVWFISYVWFTPEYVEGDLSDDDTTAYYTCGEKIKKKILHFRAIQLDKLPEIKKRDFDGIKGTLRYFKQGILHIYQNEACFTGLVHAFFVCLFWKLMSAAVPLNLASSNVDTSVTPELSNLCAGEITNLFYEFAWNNVFYVIGAIIYIIVLVRTPPLRFYKWFWPFIGVFFAVCITPLLFDLPYSLQVILAATVAVFPFFLWRYDSYLCNASVDGEYVGVLQALIGYIRYITPAVPGIFLAYGLVDMVFLVAYIALFLSVIFSIYAAFKHRAALAAIAADSHNEPSWLSKQLSNAVN